MDVANALGAIVMMLVTNGIVLTDDGDDRRCLGEWRRGVITDIEACNREAAQIEAAERNEK